MKMKKIPVREKKPAGLGNRPAVYDRITFKIGRVVLPAILVGLAVLMVAVIFTVANAITRNVNESFRQTAQSNALYAEVVLDAAENAYNLTQSYLETSFKDEAEYTGRISIDRTSRVNSMLQISPFAFEREGILLTTMWATVNGDDAILGMGVLFEKNAFDKRTPNYTIYVSQEDAASRTSRDLGFYGMYSKNEYYAVPARSGTAYMSSPSTMDGHTFTTVSYPLTHNGTFIGVMMVELNLAKLSQIASTSSIYTTMQSGIITGDGIVVYDSLRADLVGQHDSTRYASEYDKVQAGLAAGVAFEARPRGHEKDTRVCFYAPVNTAAGNWWTSCSLTWKDLIQTQQIVFIQGAAFSVMVLLVISAILIVTLRRILNPVYGLIDVSEKLCVGDLEVSIAAKGKDEIGILASHFAHLTSHQKTLIEDVVMRLDRLADGDFTDIPVEDGVYTGYYTKILDAKRNITRNMSGALNLINESADQVSSGADQVSNAAQDLSQGATEQASAVEQLSATIIECTQDVEGIARGAQIAKAISIESGEGIEECNRFMEQLTTAMDEISRTSGEIGNIIKTIDDIAFQTNILALNAAVEAARAGAAGKGFAVVADEVRSLAGKSAEAAQNTTALIEKTVAAIENGTKITEGTAIALTAAVEKTVRVNEQVQHIAEASQRQYEAMRQISSGVEQISGVVQTNSATSEETAAASQELNAQAQTMKEQVSRFRLN